MFRVVVVALLLCSCSSKGKQAEERLAMIERAGGSKAEICEAARAVATAYLDADDEDRYKSARLTADIDCLSAKLG